MASRFEPGMMKSLSISKGKKLVLGKRMTMGSQILKNKHGNVVPVHRSMKAYGAVVVELKPFFTCALDGGE
jgi:hypothetical protein